LLDNKLSKNLKLNHLLTFDSRKKGSSIGYFLYTQQKQYFLKIE